MASQDLFNPEWEGESLTQLIDRNGAPGIGLLGLLPEEQEESEQTPIQFRYSPGVMVQHMLLLKERNERMLTVYSNLERDAIGFTRASLKSRADLEAIQSQFEDNMKMLSKVKHLPIATCPNCFIQIHCPDFTNIKK